MLEIQPDRCLWLRSEDHNAAKDLDSKGQVQGVSHGSQDSIVNWNKAIYHLGL